MSNRLPLAALLALLFASGCGTIGNFSPGKRMVGGPPTPKVFGGVREDAEFLTGTDPYRSGTNPGQLFGAVLVLVDLPVSFVADVFTLPWALKATRQRKAWPVEPLLP